MCEIGTVGTFSTLLLSSPLKEDITSGFFSREDEDEVHGQSDQSEVYGNSDDLWPYKV